MLKPSMVTFPLFIYLFIHSFIPFWFTACQKQNNKLFSGTVSFFLCDLRLAKSTLTLIPLLGTHEVIFAFITDEHARGMLLFVKLFTELSFASFQVAFIPCTCGYFVTAVWCPAHALIPVRRISQFSTGYCRFMTVIR